MKRLTTIVLMLLALPAVLVAQGLTQDELGKLDSAHSRYKVSPEMVPAILDLVRPYELDSELPGGWLLDGITIERFYVRLTLLKDSAAFHLDLLPPTIDKPGAERSKSFAVVSHGDVHGPARDALLQSIVANDDGTFWPELPTVQAQEGNTVPPSVRKVHFSQLLGDFLLVLLVVALFLAGAAVAAAFSDFSLKDWWLLVAVVAYALLVRILYYVLAGEQAAEAVWTPASELPHISAAWFLNTLHRFVVVNLDLVALIHVGLGTLTVVAVFLSMRLLFEGALAACLAALFVASFPAHIALSATATLMIPFCALLALLLLVQLVYEKTRDPRVLFLSGLLVFVALFMRPESLLFVPPLVILPFVRKGSKPAGLKQLASFLACCAILVALRIWSLSAGPASPDPFLSWDLSVAACFHNFGVWFVNLGRTPLIAMVLWAAGLATRPWRRDPWLFGIMAWWLVAGYALYFHVDMTESLQGGRLVLAFMVPLAYLVAWGATLLQKLSDKRRRWALVLTVLWLLLSPAFHYSALTYNFKAVYEDSFLVEA